MEIIYSLNDVDKVAIQLIQHAKTKTLLIYGGMGVGKTTLIKEIVKGLGSNDEVTSPTFSIVNEYHSENEIIYHFDFYRINDIEEAFNFGVEEYLYSNNWCIIEWPDKIQSILPKLVDRIDLDLNPDNSRSLKLKSIKEKTN
ncbi:MAG TPA: tRNA (adenosine(37)-N6)-threonylcarbamoyltransferase complex ATPase subunit type 1 TsaE [Flavobacteriaceae bacterium]|nr:tRNA (adenosine(37)-N6)-threonylcarbamoyltransferase complex ATPase subunit type 1 TsaE [Flavobacteriaceae bacterium]